MLGIVLSMLGALGACSLINPSSASILGDSNISSAQVISGKLPACNPALLVTTDDVFDTLYAISYNFDLSVPQLRVINPHTAQTLARVTLTSTDGTIDRVNGLAANPLTGALWAIVRFQGSGGNRSLVTIDPFSGALTLIGSLGDRFAEIAFDACGRLFGVTGDGASNPETLYLIDKTDGSLTWLRMLGNGGDGEVISFNPYTGVLYHSSGCTGLLETVNINDGTATNVPTSGDFFCELNSLTFGLGGSGFYATNIGGELFNISTNGLSNSIGFVDNIIFSERTHGLAFAPRTIPVGDPEAPPASGPPSDGGGEG